MRAHILEDCEAAEADGQAGGAPPGLSADAWPRSLTNGAALLHVLTLRLPAALRPPEAPGAGFALFQDDNLFARDEPGAAAALGGAPLRPRQAGQPFWEGLARAARARPPGLRWLSDPLGGAWALLWLDEAQLTGPPTPLPADHRPPGVRRLALDRTTPARPLRLRPRPDDPNDGIPPANPRHRPWRALPPAQRAALAEAAPLGQLSGTCLSQPAPPPGLSAWFLDLEDGLGGVNFAGHRGVVDLCGGGVWWGAG